MFNKVVLKILVDKIVYRKSGGIMEIKFFFVSRAREFIGCVKGKPKYRVRTVKCPRYVDGSLVANERSEAKRNEPNGII